MVGREAIIPGRSGLAGHLGQRKSGRGTEPEQMGDKDSRQFGEGRGGVGTLQEAGERKCSESLTQCISQGDGHRCKEPKRLRVEMDGKAASQPKSNQLF